MTLSSTAIIGKRLERPDETDKRERDEVEGFGVGRGGSAATLFELALESFLLCILLRVLSLTVL